MEAFLPESVKMVLAAMLAIVFALSWLSRRLPRVTWLQFFRLPDLRLSEAQKARRRRFANWIAAGEIITLGLALPLIYLALTVMMFNEPELPAMIIVGLCSLLCIAAGILVLARNR